MEKQALLNELRALDKRLTTVMHSAQNNYENARGWSQGFCEGQRSAADEALELLHEIIEKAEG